jgi:hypothetical protein
MHRIISNINENETYVHTGNLHVIGNIGNHAAITITDGELVIDGNIGNQVLITLSSKLTANEYYFQVKGTIGNDVTIVSKSAHIDIKGPSGAGLSISTMSGHINAMDIDRQSKLTSMSGHITARNIASQVTLFTMSGNINVHDVNALGDLITTNPTELGWITESTPFHIYTNTSLFTMSGKIYAGRVAAHSRLIAMAGDIHVKEAHLLSLLVALNGDIYESDVRRHIERPRFAHQITLQVQWSNTKLLEYTVIRENLVLINTYRVLSIHNLNNQSPLNSDPPRNTYQRTHIPRLNMHLLGGFIAILGVVAVAIAFTILHAASVNPLGLIVGGIGIGMLAAGYGLFKNEQNHRQESTNVVAVRSCV